MMMMSPWRTRAAAAAGPLGISCLQTSYHSFTVSSFHFSHTSLQKVFLHNGPFRQCLQFSQKGLWILRREGKNFIDKIFDSVKNLEIIPHVLVMYLVFVTNITNAQFTLFCREIGFVQIHALLCGEKLNQKLRLWRKISNIRYGFGWLCNSASPFGTGIGGLANTIVPYLLASHS